ncbi:MAG: DUF362 domain-containing protein [Clostridia bacterium]|nr:DUF362 domain-containing protein [Clostridia bacterium]
MASIYINNGVRPQAMTRELLEAAGVAKKLSPTLKVVIKPNLVLARPAVEGATTHPEVVEGIVQFLKDCGVSDITVAEGSWLGGDTRRAWEVCGYAALAKQYGLRLIDTKKDRLVTRKLAGLTLSLCQSTLEADYLINAPVLKAHCQTLMTCCLKNLKGCIPDSEKRRYHTLSLHEPIAALATAIRPDLHVVDSLCGDLSFEEGGNPVPTHRILLGFDPVLLDSYGAALMGIDPEEIRYLRLARDYGVGRFAGPDTRVAELHPEDRPRGRAHTGRTAQRYTAHIHEDSACSACYAALIYALHKIGASHVRGPIHIGQGLRGKTISGVGVGNCALGCTHSLPGCPPKGLDIVTFLRNCDE